VRRRLREDHPFPVLAYASSLYSAFDPRNRNPFKRDASPGPSREEIIQSFLDVDVVETSVLLHAFAQLTDDELVRARIRRELAERSHALPTWIKHLPRATPYRAVEMTHVLGDGDNVMLGVRLPRDTELTLVVYIDHNLGTVVKDAFAVPEPIAELVVFMQEKEGKDSDTAWNELDLADARVRIADAIEVGAIAWPPYETDTWPACRPLVEWISRLLPEGGRGYERRALDDVDLKDLARRFFESPFASDLAAEEDSAELLDSLLWFGSDYGPGDPLHWSPVSVEILLVDWIPRKIVAPASFLAKAPEVLRAFIRFAYHEREIRDALTMETLDAVDRWEPAYQQAIRSPRPQGPTGLLAAMGLVDPEEAKTTSVEADGFGGVRRDRPSPRERPRGAASPHVVEAVENSIVIRRFQALTDFYGEGRKLTKKGNPTLADARKLIGLVGTSDEMDETIGDQTFKTTSATELPELMFTVRWAISAGVLRKEHGKLRTTTGWCKLAGKPLKQWVKSADSLLKLGPLATYYAHAGYQAGVLDEVATDLLEWLLDGSLHFQAALDRVCQHADARYEWLSPYMQEPENRRRTFAGDLDTLAMILGWAGIVDRVDTTWEPDEWLPKRKRPVGGTLQLTGPGRWWLGSGRGD
jgi:hypothetical protein